MKSKPNQAFKNSHGKLFNMRNNIGIYDKTIRMILVIMIGFVVFTKLIIGSIAILLFLLAILLVSTCYSGNCPFYRLLGINTKRNLNDKAKIYERNQAMLRNYHKHSKDMYTIPHNQSN